MNRSNYQLYFLPIRLEGFGRFGFSVDLKDEFVDFAKNQKLDSQLYERNGKEILKACGFNDSSIKIAQLDEIGIYGWHKDYSGLLVRASVPGKEENNISLSTTPTYRLTPHNIDTVQQFTAAFALVNKWLIDIELRIPKKG